MKILLSIHWTLLAAIWYFGAGLLHDFYVIKEHKAAYDLELLRLLMDGHVLMLSGAVVFVCWLMMISKIQCGGLIGIIVGVFMLLYCAMIFPFLKSFATMGISIMLIIVSIKAITDFPNIWEVMKNYR